MDVKRLWWRFRSWFNYWTYCAFWECEPPDDGTWWRTRDNTIVMTPETATCCGHCRRKLPGL